MPKPSSISPAPTALILIFAVMLAGGCAADGVRQQAASQRKIERTKQSLIAAGDADSLAAAALLSFGPSAEAAGRLALVTRAVAAAPDRPDLAWLDLRLCSQIAACDPAPLEARLRLMDPSNGAAWWDSLTRAAKRDDAAALRADLAAMAASTRFDTYWNATIVHATNAIFRTHTMDLNVALLTILGVASAVAVPPYQSIVNACQSEQLRDQEVLDACRGVSLVMRSGDTYLTELIGIAIARRAWPDGSTESLDALAARRVARYRMDADGSALDRGWNFRHAGQQLRLRLALMTENDTEQKVYVAELERAHLSVDPPASWTDPRDGISR